MKKSGAGKQSAAREFQPVAAREPQEYVFSKTFYGKKQKQPDTRTYRALGDCGCDDRH